MKALLHRLLKALAYLAAGVVILLAIAVGLFRLLLPRLPAYQEEIKGWANAAIGMQVEFSGMNARWRFSGPELNFYNAELVMPDAAGGAFAADEVSIGVDLMQLIIDRQLVVDRIVVRDSAVDVRRDEDGGWRVQDIPLATLAETFAAGQGAGEMTVIAEDFDVRYRHAPAGAAIDFHIDNLRMTRTARRLTVDSVIALPESLGSRLNASVSVRPEAGRWRYAIDGRDLNLAGWNALQPAALPPLAGGRADLALSVEQAGARPINAVVEFDVEDLQADGGTAPFGAAGRLEYEADDAGWLLLVEEFRLRTERGIWPESTLSLRAGRDADGGLASLSASASHVDLDDLERLAPWLPERYAALLARYDPGGVLGNLSLSLADLGADTPRYDVSVELADAGLRADERFPGLRGFSGSLRANRSGGRVEIDSADLAVDLTRWLEAPLTFASAQGTVIWRRSATGTIVLSDSIRLQNADLTSRSNVQLSLPADGSSPVLDLESRWSVYDISATRRYLPARLMDPRLVRWLDTALVAGRATTGITRLSGALDRFPFDDGDGVFRVEAELEDAVLRYSDLWPDVRNLDMQVIVEGMRLYSTRNTAINAGNSVVDANIEIADLRRPVLTIDAFATGTLESVRTLARESPIARVFGGQLDRVSVSGDASFTLNLEYPILRREDFAFTTRVQASNGTLRIDGFPAPVSELNGIVSVSRDSIAAESLFGRFLGEAVSIELDRAGDDLPGYGVIATANGRVTADGLAAGFGLPATDFLAGGSNYRARLLFPAGGDAAPAPFTVAIDSGLEGLTARLPPPFGKARGTRRALAARIELPADGRIDARGTLGEAVRWTLDFARGPAGWDLDRGVVALGGAYPASAETRGLHVMGELGTLRLADWLDLADDDGRSAGGVASRIRSIDVNVADLYALGQHYRQHRVVVDRRGSDWLVQLDGEQVAGTLAIPYDLDGERPLTLDMRTLVLPGNDEEDGDGVPFSADPRRMPALSLRAASFALGERRLGRVTADFLRTPDGLVADNVVAEHESFGIRGAAGWVVDTREPSGQRTWVNATLVSRDVAATMQSLDSRPGIAGNDMEIRFDVSWSGGPREDFLASLDGDVVVRFGTGQLNEVEPGAGRMFGLLSVVALPRRLALDFRDVLDRGFLFDEITGTFRLDDGSAYTCDLSLKGPAADIGIVGRAGLVEKDYLQSAIVSANVGNTLPVVGAVVAGPQVAAALLIFSQIFKKPLQEMGQVYYGIEGSRDEPAVESVNARRFAEVSRMAGCLDGDD